MRLIARTLPLAFALIAAGCGKKESAPPQDAGGAIAPAPTTAAVQVASVQLGKGIDASKRVVNETAVFAPKDSIYASVHTTGTGQDVKLMARWSFQDGQVVDERTESIAPTGDAYTAFHIAKPSGWPAGKYTLQILLNGQQVQSKDFTVQ